MSAILGKLSPAQRRAAVRLQRAFAAAGAELYLVGGSVRDLLLDQPAVDLDFATDAGPEMSKVAAARAGGTALHHSNERFATVGLRLDDQAIEITSLRGEPADAVEEWLRHDLALRDFTINAMAIAVTEGARLLDPFDGQGDLRRQTIRGVGDPAARLAEDPLRTLRAARFVAQLNFQVEPATRAAVMATASTLAAVSVERVGAELSKLIIAPSASSGLQFCEQVGLLPAMLPELLPLIAFAAEDSKDLWVHTLRVIAQAPPRLAVRWAALLHDIAKPRTYSVDHDGVHFFGHEVLGARLARKALTRLRLSKELVEAVGKLVELHGRPAQYDDSWTDGAVRRLMLDIGEELPDLLDLARADVTSARPQARQQARARVDGLAAHCEALRAQEEARRYQSPLDGDQLMAIFGLPPGPWLRPLKAHLRDLVIDDQLTAGDVDGARAAAAAWMAQHHTATPT